MEQQYARLETWFPDISTESLIGGDEEDKPKIEVLLTQKTKRGKPMCQVSAMPINRQIMDEKYLLDIQYNPGVINVLRFSVQPRGHQVHFVPLRIPMFRHI